MRAEERSVLNICVIPTHFSILFLLSMKARGRGRGALTQWAIKNA